MKNISYRSQREAGFAYNKYKYNAGTEHNEELEVQYYETPLRNYDPQTGRFNCVDILAEHYFALTPYQFAGNNPVSYNDPFGDQFTQNGRLQQGPDGEYHVGWLSDMMWENQNSFSWNEWGSSGGSGDYSAYWAFFIDANFGNGEGKPTSIVSNIPGFGQAYFGNVNGMWGFFNSITNAAYTGGNSKINALSATLMSLASSSNSVVSGRFFEMLTGSITHNIFTDRNLISTLNGVERDISGNAISTNTFFSTQANGGVQENRISNNGATYYRAQFAADFLSSTYLNAKYGTVFPSNQIANGYFNNGTVYWLQGNQSSQKPLYGTQGQFVQSSKNAADWAYIENVTLSQYGYPQRTFYMSLFMSVGGNQLEHSRLGHSGGLGNFYGIFMFNNFHF
ncbi:MAG: hypothetical protein IPQ27_07845 [Chitinophagaceae bacterium]|nr:hypothetical protein [Chitinophagaceae bacterium]